MQMGEGRRGGVGGMCFQEGINEVEERHFRKEKERMEERSKGGGKV